MSLRIRLRRVGRKKQPSYRIVVANSAAPRDGAYVDELGFYNPRTKPAELRLDLGKVDNWLEKGATLSTTAASLVRKARKGGDAKVGYKVREAAMAATPVAEEPEAPPQPRKRARAGSAGTGAPVASTEATTPAPEPAAAEQPAEPAEAPASEPAGAEGAAE